MFQLYLLLRFGSQAICKQWTTDIFFISKISRLYAFSN